MIYASGSRRLTFGAFFVLAAVTLFACGTDTPTPMKPIALRHLEPILPEIPGPFAPSEMRTVGTPDANAGARIADVDTCEGCHEDAALAWKKSAHAFASFDNPVYRASVDRFRKDRGNHASNFCGGCHDVALTVDKAMDAEILPEDPRAHAGVACRVCHGIKSASRVGNGSYEIDTSEIPVPVPNDAGSIGRHRARVASPTLRGDAICVACHRATLDDTTGNTHHLVGQDDATPWMRSAYAGSNATRVDPGVKRESCTSCHMPKVAAVNDQGSKSGKIASHRFLGGNTYLAAMTKDDDTLARVRTMLDEAATIKIIGVVNEKDHAVQYVQDERISAKVGDDLRLDTVVKNERVGHRFPGGVLDAQDTWIEVTVRDAHDNLIADAGTDHAFRDQGRADAPDVTDESTHVLTAYMVDANGDRLLGRETHEFATAVWNTTIAPRDAVVISYTLHVPDDLAPEDFPIAVTTTLRHRSRDLTLARAACDESRSPRGQAFGRYGLKNVARGLDGCVPQPITTIDESRIFLDSTSSGGEFGPNEVYDYALGLSHVLQERLGEAARAGERALAVAETDQDRGVANALLADVMAHQGRLDATRVYLGRARGFLGDEPALARIEADALATTWRFADASFFLTNATARAPLDDATWGQLAVMRGGALDAQGSLDAAIFGLRVNPRDETLLRMQALSLESLGAPTELRERALDAYLYRRTPDDAPSIRARCSNTVPGCANERIPVHSHPLRPAPQHRTLP